MRWIKNLISKSKKDKTPTPRYDTATEFCVNCNMGLAIIYDQDYDCCTTCNTKWEINQIKKAD